MPSRPKILVVLPRNMDFSAERATSIDLCAFDFCINSRYKSQILVCGASSTVPLPNVDFVDIGYGVSSRARRKRICSIIRQFGIETIIVHQHLPTAVHIKKKFPGAFVAIHRHNYVKSYKDAPVWRRVLKRMKLREMALINKYVVVSDSVREEFLQDWPMFGDKCLRVHNFVNFGEWEPSAVRTKEVIFAGRCVPEKGVLEAAQATIQVLSSNPDWKATFILSCLEEKPAYTDSVLSLLKNSSVAVLADQPFTVVKSKMEDAAVVLVPSIWMEAFGRTALEAHAGGAAVISSGRGGLKEVSGDAALYVDPENHREFGSSIERVLHDDELRQRLQSQGHDHVRRVFSLENTVARYDQMIAGALHDHR